MYDETKDVIKTALNQDRTRLIEIIKSDIERVKNVDEKCIQYVITPSAMDQGSTLSVLKPSWLNRNRKFEMETVWRLRSVDNVDIYGVAREEVIKFMRDVIQEVNVGIKIECFINGNGEVLLLSA